MARVISSAFLSLLLFAAVVCAQAGAAASSIAGHWVGTMQTNAGLGVELDLAREGEGWRGTISIPMQGAKGVPLSDILVKDNTVSFTLKGVPGDPKFAGQLAADGKAMSGMFTQGGASVPMALAWKGEAQFEKAVKNPAVSKTLLGTWEGSLTVQGVPLRLRLTLVNGPQGATGTFLSLDQGNAQIPITTIAEEGTKLKLTISMISGSYEAEVRGDELAGTWTQGPGTYPLVLKRKP